MIDLFCRKTKKVNRKIYSDHLMETETVQDQNSTFRIQFFVRNRQTTNQPKTKDLQKVL